MLPSPLHLLLLGAAGSGSCVGLHLLRSWNQLFFLKQLTLLHKEARLGAWPQQQLG